MLEVTRERRGKPRSALFHFTRLEGKRAGGAATMTVKFTGAASFSGESGAVEQSTFDFLEEVEGLYRDAAEQLFTALRAVKKGKIDDVKVAAQAVKDLKLTIDWVMDERNRVDKVRKQAVGVVGAADLDFVAARDEIGRRLAVLRDAGRD